MPSRFVEFPLEAFVPSFASPLTDVVIELDHLRRLHLSGDTPPPLFMQLKNIFHMLESLGSARIEGNHTTLADYIENKIESPSRSSDQIREVSNIEKAMTYVEESMQASEPLSQHFIRELHQMVVDDLEREGDKTPGQYRTSSVRIAGAAHIPPQAVIVPELMEALVRFVNREDAPKYDLLKMAAAHHRFCWIHPFSNGNGRTVRLLSYAMLIKYGFNVRAGGRILNPTAVFCNDRNIYYDRLAGADTGTYEGTEAWCLYVLGGIRDELEKVDKITKYNYLQEKILRPALTWSKARKQFTPEEEMVLSMAIHQGVFRAADVDKVLPALAKRQRTYLISKLIQQSMIQPVTKRGRAYTISFTHSYLLRGIVHALEKEGFIASFVKG